MFALAINTLDWIFDIANIEWKDALIVAGIGFLVMLAGIALNEALKDFDFSLVTQVVGPVVELVVAIFGDGGYFNAAIGGTVGLSE